MLRDLAQTVNEKNGREFLHSTKGTQAAPVRTSLRSEAAAGMLPVSGEAD
jgi:hypothetical protein